MRVTDDFDPNGILLNMYHLVQLKRAQGNKGYIYRALMVDIYEEYQRSYVWKELRKQVKERDKMRCRECGKEVLKYGVIHHRSYENWGKGDEREMADCVFVCKGCHNHIHKATDIYVPFWAMTSPQSVGVTWDDEIRMSNNFI
ncbi:MAG: hypothetical protein A2Y38_07265 [Spirochaetes bacterium GWB1_59_5]|nr:MAG: hypothetical protein A2Y38_07265 [Spirochaetes bacterium GWB1_59_5]